MSRVMNALVLLERAIHVSAHRAMLIAVAILLAALAARSEAGVVTFVGAQPDQGGAWRTASVAKPYDIDGNNVLGSDGYWLVGQNGSTALPAYVTAFAKTGNIYGGNANYVGVDNPAVPGSTTWPGTTTTPSNGNVLSFTFTGNLPGTVRLGVMFDALDNTFYNPSSVTIKLNGVNASTIDVSGGAFRNRNPDWLLWDIANPVAGDQIIFTGVSASNQVTLTAFTFDSLAVVPVTWNQTGGGNWNTATNWTPNQIPNSAGATVSLGPSLTNPGTVNIGSSVTVGTLNINSPNAYTLSASAGQTLTMQAPSGATIQNAAGSHMISANVNLASNTTITVANLADTLSISGVIGAPAAQSLTKNGPGMLTLSGANTYAGATAVNQGTLKVASGGVIASGSAITVANGASLTVTGSGAVNSNSITLASGGVLDVFATASTFTMGAGRTLTAGRSGAPGNDILGSLIANGATIDIGGTAAARTLGLQGDLTLNGGIVKFDLTNNTTPDGGINDLVAVGRHLALAGATTVQADLLPAGIVNGNYTLFTYGGTLTGDAANLTLAGTIPNTVRGIFAFDTTTSPGSVLLSASGVSADLTWKGDGATNLWDVKGASNWTKDAAADKFYNLDNVTFDDGTSNTTVTLSGILQPKSVAVNNPARDYAFTGAGKITGITGLSKSGAAALNLGTVNDFTGPVTVNGGTISVATLPNGGAAGPLGASSNAATNLVLNGGTLKYTGAAVTSDRLFSLGTSGGTLDASGSGALTLNNTGAMGFNNQVGPRTLMLTGTNSGVNALAALIADQNAADGKTALVKSGDGLWRLTRGNTYSGGTTINGGTLETTAFSALGAVVPGNDITINSGATLRFSSHDAFGNAGIVTPPLTITIRGGTMTSNNTFTTVGPIVLDGGTIQDNGGANANYRAFTLRSTVTVLANDDPSYITRVGGANNGIHLRTPTTFDVADGGAADDLIVSAEFRNIDAADPGNPASLMKTGPGRMVLTAPSVYTGTTTVNGGTLAIVDGGAISAGSAVIVNDGGTLTVSGTGNLASNAITLSAGGILDVSAAAPFSMGPGRTLTGGRDESPANDVLGDFVASGSTLDPGGYGAGRTLTFANALTLDGATLRFDLPGVAGGNDSVVVGGDLSLVGASTTIAINPAAVPGAGTFTLITYGGTLFGGAESFTLTGTAAGPRGDWTLDTTTTAGKILVTSPYASLVWAGGGATGNTWDAEVTQSWTNNGNPDVFYSQDSVTFNDSGNNASDIMLEGTLTPGPVTVDNSATHPYTFSTFGDGKLSGGASLIKRGQGTLTLSTANDYTGGTTVDGGTLMIGAGGVPGTGPITVNSGGTLNFARGDTWGPLDGAASPVITINSGGTVTNDSFYLNTLKGLNLNGGTLTSADGDFSIQAAWALDGPVTVGGAAMSVISGASFNSGVLLHNTVFNVADAAEGTDLLVSAPLLDWRDSLGNTQASSLVKTGAGTLTLTDNNAYTGNTLVQGGTLEIDGGTISGPGLLDIGTTGGLPAHFVLKSGSVTVGTQFVVGAHGVNSNSSQSDGTLQVNGVFFLGGYGEGTGTGTYTQTGGTVTVTDGTLGVNFGGGGPNAGVYNLDGGWLTTRLFTKSGSGSATINFNGGTLLPSASSPNFLQGLTVANIRDGGLILDTNGLNVIIGQALVHSGIVGDNAIDGGLWKFGAGVVTLTGTNTYTGGTIIENGAVSISSDANIGGPVSTITFNGGMLQVTGTALANLDSHVVNWSSFTGGFDIAAPSHVFTVSQAVTGGGSLTKAGAGTLVLANTGNTYQGGTTLNAGTLSINSPDNVGGPASSLTFNGGMLQVTGTAIANLDGHSINDFGFNGGFDVAEAAHTLTLSQALAGVGGLRKAGPGTLKLTGANWYTGGTTVNAGTLQGTTNSLQGNINLTAAGANVTFDQAEDGQFSGSISGPGSLTKTGAGTLVLAGSTLPSGGTLVSAGTLQGPASSLRGNITVATPGTSVAFDQPTDGTYDMVVSGPGSLTKIGGGILTLTGKNTYQGTTVVGEGVLRLGTAAPAGMSLWLDAAAPSTLSQNYDGSGVVTGEGEQVGYWADRSGNGKPAVQGNAWSRPTYTTSGDTINGKPVLVFDGIDDDITSALNINPSAMPNMSLFIVYRQTGDPPSLNAGLWGHDDGGWDRLQLLNFSNGGLPDGYPIASSSDRIPVNGMHTTEPLLYTAVLQNGVTNGSSVFLNGVADATTGLPAFTSTDFGGLPSITFGNISPGNGYRGNIQVGEILVYDAAMDAEARAAVEAYLLAKWFGDGASLPGDRIPDTSEVLVAGGATLDLADSSETIGPLDGFGNVQLGSATLTINSVSESTFAGEITGTGMLVKTGPEMQELAGVNSYTGGTEVHEGTLLVSNANALAAGGALTIGAGGTVVLGEGLAAGVSAQGTSVNAVPEPGTLALLAVAALAGLAAWRRRD